MTHSLCRLDDIRDRGIGIPKQHQKRVLERFYRVPDAKVRARHGTGLGLFVAHALVRLLGGQLTVHSEPEEPGTTMHVRIPMQSRQHKEVPAKRRRLLFRSTT